MVALGFVNPQTHPNPVNRWRARIAVRSAAALRSQGYDVTILCCGGAVRGDTSEAQHLAVSIRRLGWSGPLLLDVASRSTWENIALALPVLERTDRLAIASNGLHAAKAREYLRRQAPIIADRLIPASEYRLGEMVLAKPLFAAVGVLKLRSLRTTAGTTASDRRPKRST
ncbi:ElyC/SanA/YdcF family protein [Curtobacterium caseinilyticum]|uniref:ElyC/SanA/YdcF family protein n=1 Tax=Curtobacterium caseinilyticum TaxID=3055137 RepID=A0ABT7TRN0_9MICO|nr:ElyC/SanA/YdcF family protein [Curtobacterium caseinilyticum]MDM7892268.1 ElyC/SanA/YdcF family protein [Curtobacterium caseinilyticum]